MWSDVVLAARRLLRAKTFTVAAVAMLAAGVGANSALFATARSVLAGRPGVSDPDTLVSIRRGGFPFSRATVFVSYPDYRDIEASRVFEAVIAYRFFREPVRLTGDARIVFGEFVSNNYFSVLGVRPALGRLINAEDQAASRDIGVISTRLWEQHYGGSHSALGKTIRLRNREITVVGVAPRSFRGLYAPSILPADLWVPVHLAPALGPPAPALDDRDGRCVQVWGRLPPGVDLRQIRPALGALANALELTYPSHAREPARTFEPVPVLDVWVHESFDPLVKNAFGVVAVISALILLLTCTQLSTLVLARNSDRYGEMAVRTALGAGRGRLLRLLLTESLLVASGGAIGAHLAGRGLATALSGIAPPSLRGVTIELRPAVDGMAFAFTFGLAITSVAFFGFLPTLRASRPDLARLLSLDAAVGVAVGHRLRGRHVLVAVQIAVSTMLLVLAGSLSRTLLRATSAEVGVHADRVALVGLELGTQGYDEAAARSLLEAAAARAASLPGVQATSFGDALPGVDILDSIGYAWVTAEGLTEERALAQFSRVAPGYLDVVGLRLLDGRDFTPADRAGSPLVAVVGESFARRLWPAGSALGRQFSMDGAPGLHLTVVGVASDARLDRLGGKRVTSSRFYVPFAQRPATSAFLLARTAGNAMPLALPLDRVVKSLDANLATTQATTMAGHFQERLYPAKVAATIILSLGLLALCLGVVGIYGLATYLVSRRRRELALRLALGATPANLTTIVLRRSVWMAAAGAAIGVVLAMSTARVVAAVFVSPGALDLGVSVAVPLGAIAIALLACVGPALAAARVDPMVGLKSL